MVVDTSALLAILLGEPDADQFVAALERGPHLSISAVQLLESAIVIESRKGPDGGRELDLLLRLIEVRVVDLTPDLVALAREAWRRWGKGNPSARLNFRDCCAYALAQQLKEPLPSRGRTFGGRMCSRRCEAPLKMNALALFRRWFFSSVHSHGFPYGFDQRMGLVFVFLFISQPFAEFADKVGIECA